MDEKYCRTCLSRQLPDVVEPCKSCEKKSNWNKWNKSRLGKPRTFIGEYASGQGLREARISFNM